MTDPNPFGAKREGLWARLLNRTTQAQTRTKRVVRRTELLNMTVPAGHADAVRVAVERWLAGHGIAATVTSEDAGDGKTRLRTSLDRDDAPKLDLSSEAVQSELEKILSDAVSNAPR
jgi:hypothetical protein